MFFSPEPARMPDSDTDVTNAASRRREELSITWCLGNSSDHTLDYPDEICRFRDCGIPSVSIRAQHITTSFYHNLYI